LIFSQYAKLQIVERIKFTVDYRRAWAGSTPTIISPFKTEEQIIKSRFEHLRPRSGQAKFFAYQLWSITIMKNWQKNETEKQKKREIFSGLL